jgi:ribonucrease Y
VVQKSGSWFAFGETRLGQGKEKAAEFLAAHPELAAEVRERVLDAIGGGAAAAPRPPTTRSRTRMTGLGGSSRSSRRRRRGVGYLLRRSRDQEVLAAAEAEARAIRDRPPRGAGARPRAAERGTRQRLAEARARSRRSAAHREQLDADERRARRSRAELERARADLEEGRTSLREAREELRRDREKIEQIEERLTRRGEQQDARALRLDENEERLDQRARDLEGEAEAADRSARRGRPAALRGRAALARAGHRDDPRATRPRARAREGDARAGRHRAGRRGVARRAQDDPRPGDPALGLEVSAAISVSVVPIPSDAMKGRIIGREGRNIRAFEALTGVDVIIDDTPEAVLLSSFNPIRREVAKLALTELVGDGRIHPARIEEVVQKAQQEMQTYIRERGEEGALEANVVGIKPGLIQLLGRMHFRTSYGQNILKHSVQVAHLSGIIAAELGLDVAMARRAGCCTTSASRSTARSRAPTRRSAPTRPPLRRAARGDRRDRQPPRPGACRDPLPRPRERRRRDQRGPAGRAPRDAGELPQAPRGAREIATSFPGVEKSYAIQAGREIRIIVEPDKVDDASAVLLARDIAQRIERDMEYPGQVQVTVVRESRAVEYAR